MNGILACPACKAQSLSTSGDVVSCGSCGATYPVKDGVIVFLRPDSAVLRDDADRAEFWNAGWQNRSAYMLTLDRDGLLAERRRCFEDLSAEGYPSVTGVSPATVGGKVFLNIGCGGGYEGLLFAGYGTRYIGIDVTYNAARYTHEVVRKAGFDGVAYQAEAEALPLADDSIDFVYSSGVLHHTPDIEVTLREAHRVLKPGGTAMIGLYATHSVMFLWYRLHAVLRGNWTAKSIDAWIHANTEGAWSTAGRRNKWTATFSRAEMHDLLSGAGFADIVLEQSQVQLKVLPILGRLTRFLPERIRGMRLGPWGGMLVATCTKR